MSHKLWFITDTYVRKFVFQILNISNISGLLFQILCRSCFKCSKNSNFLLPVSHFRFYLKLFAKFLSSSSSSVDFDSAISPLSSAFSRSISTRFNFDGFSNYFRLGGALTPKIRLSLSQSELIFKPALWATSAYAVSDFSATSKI